MSGDTIQCDKNPKTCGAKLLLHLHHAPVTLWRALHLALSGLSDTVKQNAQSREFVHIPLGQNAACPALIPQKPHGKKR